MMTRPSNVSVRRLRLVTLIIAACCLAAGAAAAAPQRGTLDETFGDGGVVITPIPGGAMVKELFVLDGGRILAVGGFSRDEGTIRGVAVARYLAGGTLDGDFGDGGVSAVEITDSVVDEIYGMQAATLLPDGRIAVLGALWSDPVTLSGPALVRLNADGTLDQSFGTGGIVETPLAGGFFWDLAVDGAGRWLATGSHSGGDYPMLTARFLANGDLDPTFGDGGSVRTDFSPRPDQAHGVLLQPDGGIIVTGSVNQEGSEWDFAALRLLESGDLDPAFGDGGLRTVAFGPGSYDYGQASTLAPDGKILIGGTSGHVFGIARLLENGDLDPTFGESGTVREGFFSLLATMGAGLAVDVEGRILAGGTGYAGAAFSGFLLAAWTAAGELDTGFGDGGAAMPELPDYQANAAALALQPDGKILLGGASDRAFTIVRYHGAGVIFADGFESGDTSAWSGE